MVFKYIYISISIYLSISISIYIYIYIYIYTHTNASVLTLSLKFLFINEEKIIFISDNCKLGYSDNSPALSINSCMKGIFLKSIVSDRK